MAENRNLEDRQFISIPFMWEEKPGTPKKDWKPSTSAPLMTYEPVVTPVQFLASVPFKWEEKPGKPLPYFSHSVTALPQADIISPLSPPRNSEDDDDEDDDNPMSYGDGGMSESSDMEAGDFESDDSFSSAPSLLANGLISSFTVRNAVPVEQAFHDQDGTESGVLLQSPPSPASIADSSTSSYATGATSLAGAPFLERLFPLLAPPGGSFPGKAGSKGKSAYTHTPQKVNSVDLDREGNCSGIIRRPTTLGELIMMSRRRSYQRKAIRKMKRDPPMEFMKKNAFGCGIFGGSTIGIGQLHQKWKRQFQMKIM